MYVEKIEITIAAGFVENCYLLSEGVDATHVTIVDPGAQAKRIRKAIRGRTVDAIILTHRHFDHMAAAATLAKETGAEVIAHRLDAQAVSNSAQIGLPSNPGSFVHRMTIRPVKVTRTVDEGDSILVGTEKLSVLHTPGHTIGSMCLYDEAGGILITGDTLFYGAIGRTDLPTGDSAQQKESLKKLVKLPDETKVYCGHDEDTTIGREKRYGYLRLVL
jgi:glyoxylase-like metal-dependent hydrolase (beta-lactamase superfamily II)